MSLLGALWLTLAAFANTSGNEASTGKAQPPGRSGPMGCAVSGMMYVAGGVSIESGFQSRLDAWNPDTRAWTALHSMPRARSLGAMVAVGDRLYCIGGIGEDNSSIAQVDVFDLKSGKWENPIADPMPASRLAAVALGDEIFVIGGIEHLASGESNVFSPHVRSFNTRTQAWTNRADLKIGRHGHAAALLDGRIWVTGGYADDRSSDSGQTPSVEVYDSSANRWTNGPPLQRPRAFHGMATVGDQLMVFGTRGQDRRTEVLQNAADHWTDGSPMPLQRHRFAWGVTGDRLFVFDGEDESGMAHPTIMSFDGRTSQWSVLSNSTSTDASP